MEEWDSGIVEKWVLTAWIGEMMWWENGEWKNGAVE
jgi:hypothetical protein